MQTVSRFFRVVVPTMLAATAVQASVLTPIQTINFDSANDGTFTDFGTPISLQARQDLTGFQQFDASLGTLQRVLFTVEISVEVSLSVDVDSLFDEDSPFSALVQAGFSDLQQAGIVYSPSGSTTGRAVTIDSGNIGSVGGEFLDPIEFTDFGDFFDEVSDAYGEVVFSGQPSTGELLASDPIFNMDDFVGTGFVQGLNVSAFADYSEFVSENIDEAFVEASIFLAAGQATFSTNLSRKSPSRPPTRRSLESSPWLARSCVADCKRRST